VICNASVVTVMMFHYLVCAYVPVAGSWKFTRILDRGETARIYLFYS
jgi:hypothetical protein